MNRYGRQAMDHWRQFDPARYATIANPDAFFTRLGEEVMQEIQTRTRGLEGRDRPGETYLKKVARLNTARVTAEGEVLREMVLIASPGQDEEQSDPAMTEWFARRRRELQQEQDELDAETTREPLPGE
jgi:hypothetical protein